MYTPDGKTFTDNIQVDVRVLYKTPIPTYSSKSQHSRSERPSLHREGSISSVISASTNGQALGQALGQGGQVQGRFASPTTGAFRSGLATTDKQVSSPPTSPLKTGTNKPTGLGLGGSGNHISFQPTQATARLFNQQSIHSISEQGHRSPTTTNTESDVAGEYLARPNYIAVSSAFNKDSTIPSGIISPLTPYHTTSDSLMASPSTSPRSNGFSTKVNYSTKNNVDFDTSTKTINSNVHSLKVSFLPPTHSGGGGGGGGGGCRGDERPTSPINQSPSVASSTKGRNRALIRRSVGSSAWPRGPRSMKRGGDGCIQGVTNTEVCSVIMH